jgi:hypothetical protein
MYTCQVSPVVGTDTRYVLQVANASAPTTSLLLHLACCLLCFARREAKIGPGQLGLAGGAILFVLVFVLVSSGDFATTNR